jgi:NAD(P)H-nitrite reductase large subunit
MHHLIIGAGPAGVIAAETLRKHSAQDRITLLGNEPFAPYSRMAIPYLLMGNIDQKGTWLRKDTAHFQNLNIDVRQGQVTGLNTDARTVQLASGESLGFDKLLIATGSHAANPPIEGISLPGVYHCWTLQDAEKIMAKAQPGARVLQMGAGFIGCIILEALVARGVSLTVVEMGDRMVPRMMGESAGGMIKSWVEAKGVGVMTGTRVTAIAQGDGLQVTFANGQTASYDLVICATGVKPNTAFLQGSGVVCRTGVVVDAQLQTNVAGIYAAGDCAEAFDTPSGSHVVSAIQPVAAEEARVAAMNMLGVATHLPRVPQINVLDTLGLISTSFGQWQGVPNGQTAEQTNSEASKHMSLQFEGDKLVGSNTVGWNQHAGALRGLIDGKVALGDWKEVLLQDPTQVTSAYLACAQNTSGWAGAADARRR